jgi:hypothetical protein
MSISNHKPDGSYIITNTNSSIDTISNSQIKVCITSTQSNTEILLETLPKEDDPFVDAFNFSDSDENDSEVTNSSEINPHNSTYNVIIIPHIITYIIY